MKRDYEVLVIVQPDCAENELQEIFDKLTGRVQELDGKVISAKLWERERNFYFFLQSKGAEKKKYYKGCYWLMQYTIDTEKLAEFKETIRLEERILRSMNLTLAKKLKPALSK